MTLTTTAQASGREGCALTGAMLIAGQEIACAEPKLHAIDPRTGEALSPSYCDASREDIELACAVAAEAFPIYRETSPDQRADFLEHIASAIEDLGEILIDRTMAETGLPRGRIQGERGRTVDQLRLFASMVRKGDWIEPRISLAIPDRKPAPRPDLRVRHMGLGPVAVFGASNFPLAFSVAGADTVSALAAGCPVVVKAHPAHPGTSELVGRAITSAIAASGISAGVFSLIFGGTEVGGALIADPRIKAVGFTGSRNGGLALMRIAAQRREPIPVFAEMSSINPVMLFPGALAERGELIGAAFAAANTLGAGQFCTNPGLILAIDAPELDKFIDGVRTAVSGATVQTMLTREIHAAFTLGVKMLEDHANVDVLARGLAGSGCEATAVIFETDADTFLNHAALRNEVFGPSSLLVRVRDFEQMRAVVLNLEGQLTLSAHIAEGDLPALETLLPLMEDKAGRIIVNGFGTGVEVSHAMVHGGPYPATSDGRTTSVGTLSIRRFLRPICYQDIPDPLLPDSLREGNPLGLWRVEN